MSLDSLLIRASAGTGKTYQLTARLLRILLAGAAPETILATTFTRKAAGEILRRLMLDLARAADEDQPAALDAIRQQVGDPELSRERVQALLRTVVASVHRLRVCTLDALFSQLARSFAFELDLPPGWRLTDDVDESRLRATAVGGMLATAEPAETLTLLSMLAKGETRRSIGREMISVIESNFETARLGRGNLWDSVAVPKLPDEAERRWAEAIADLRAAAAAGTGKRYPALYHRLADALETRDGESVAGDSMISKLEPLARRGEMPLYYGKPLDDSLATALRFMYDVARTERLGKLAAQNEATGRVLDDYGARIDEVKQAARSLSFADVSVRLAGLMQRTDVDSLADRSDLACDHLLLDEFQDTSPVQWSVLRPMAIGAAGGIGLRPGTASPSHSFFCVGDTKQAIYGWRGGVAEIFDSVAGQIDGVRLGEQNLSYRSSPVIMDWINEVFGNLTAHPVATGDKDAVDGSAEIAAAVRDFQTRYPDHATARDRMPGLVEMRTCRTPAAGPTGKPNAETIRDAVLDSTAQLIADLATERPELEIGVLVRTRKTIAQLVRRLVAAGVDASAEGGNPLVDSPAVRLVLSALMTAEHPGDGRWAFATAGTPVGAAAGWTADRVRRSVAELGIVDTVVQLAQAAVTVGDEQDSLRLKQLVSLAVSAASQNPVGRIADFVRRVESTPVVGARPASVRVMTIHASKGLEFDAVVLPEINGGLLPNFSETVADVPDAVSPPVAMCRYLAKDDWHFLPPRWRRAFAGAAAGRMTEALCLMYVAMTRAKSELYLVSEPHPKLAEQSSVAGLVAAATGCEGTGEADRVLVRRVG